MQLFSGIFKNSMRAYFLEWHLFKSTDSLTSTCVAILLTCLSSLHCLCVGAELVFEEVSGFKASGGKTDSLQAEQ